MIISPSSELKIMHRFFFFWIPYSLKNFLKKFENFISSGSTGWKPAQPIQRISVEVHYSSMFKFRALELVLVISPSFKLKIMHYFLFWIPYSLRNILSNFHIFSQSDRPIGNCTADSSGQLAWSTVFVDFGA